MHQDHGCFLDVSRFPLHVASWSTYCRKNRSYFYGKLAVCIYRNLRAYTHTLLYFSYSDSNPFDMRVVYYTCVCFFFVYIPGEGWWKGVGVCSKCSVPWQPNVCYIKFICLMIESYWAKAYVAFGALMIADNKIKLHCISVSAFLLANISIVDPIMQIMNIGYTLGSNQPRHRVGWWYGYVWCVYMATRDIEMEKMKQGTKHLQWC